MNFLITGGAGFIGSAVVRFLINETDHKVLNLDKLTYAGNLDSLKDVSCDERYSFIQGDVCDRTLVSKLFSEFKPDIVMHLAAESHVDRSIEGPAEFIQTNLLGTFVMLECARQYWDGLPTVTSSYAETKITGPTRETFRFHHISTDEVYGSVENDQLFTEKSAYDPSSPYSASKAGSDHLVRAWRRTYDLPVLITNCSNNYGPYQFPEKLIPLMILNALEGKTLPIYGDGQQIRDWLYVEDHVHALYTVVTRGKVGETYNVGGHNEKTNIEVVRQICDILDELLPLPGSPFVPNGIAKGGLDKKGGPSYESTPQGTALLSRNETGIIKKSYRDFIKFVTDRPGHDRRYAIDASKIQAELGWVPKETFNTGLKKTVSWYLANLAWCKKIQDGSYRRQRLGLTPSAEGRK